MGQTQGQRCGLLAGIPVHSGPAAHRRHNSYQSISKYLSQPIHIRKLTLERRSWIRVKMYLRESHSLQG